MLESPSNLYSPNTSPSGRVAIITGAGDRAFSVGGDLYQRKQMTKEEWLRQRQVFDRVLYTFLYRVPVIKGVARSNEQNVW